MRSSSRGGGARLRAVCLASSVVAGVASPLGRLGPTGKYATLPRRLDEDECNVAFTNCQYDTGCLACISELINTDQELDVSDDLGSPSTWTCEESMDLLHDHDLCSSYDAGDSHGEYICAVMSACSADDDDDGGEEPTWDDDEWNQPCNVTACDVAHPTWLGDGYCDDDMPCYNTAACGYDGGDCCASTCDTEATSWECGQPKYVCRDPGAQGCPSASRALMSVHSSGSSSDSSAGWGANAQLYSVQQGFYIPILTADAEKAGEQDLCLAEGCYVVEVDAAEGFSRDPEWGVFFASDEDTKQAVVSGGAPDVCMFNVGFEEGSDAAQYCPAACASDFYSEEACTQNELYYMVLKDAGYDGWNNVHYEIHRHDQQDQPGTAIAHGSLAYGHMAVHGVCIPEPGCYTVTLREGWFQEEVQWTLGTPTEGIVAQGGAPANCDFSVGLESYCENTCQPSVVEDEDCGGPANGIVEQLYDVALYEEDGAGWGEAKYTISHVGADESVVRDGTLAFGFQSQESVCLANGCYRFTVDDYHSGMQWAMGRHVGFDAEADDDAFTSSSSSSPSSASGLLFSGSSRAATQCVFAAGDFEGAEDCPVTCGANGANTPPPTPKPTCADGERMTVVRLVDSWGDGWNGAYYTLFQDSTPGAGDHAVTLATETLDTGAYGEFSYCLTPQCLFINVDSGSWGEEVSWSVVDQTTPNWPEVLTSGLAPENCQFSVGGYPCEEWCNSAGAADDGWVDNVDDDFWHVDDGNWYDDSTAARCHSGYECDFTELVAGWYSVGALGLCLTASVAADDMAVYNPFEEAVWEDRPDLCFGTYDFKELDMFEACAQDLDESYYPVWSEERGVKAKECMQLLLSAAPDRSEDLESDDDLVVRIATMVYYYGDSGFCDCTKAADFSPECNDFLDFNAVVRESREACYALDQIDCAYYGEYLATCQRVLPQRFGLIDFSDPTQCAYVMEDGCDNLAMPAVRRWDCLSEDNAEMSASQRDFIDNLVEKCFGDGEDEDEDEDEGEAATQPIDKHHHRKHSSKSDGAQSASVAGIILPLLLVAFLLLGIVGYLYTKKPELFKRSAAQFRAGSASNPATELAYAFAPLHAPGENEVAQTRGV